MTTINKIIVLWLLILMGYILHPQYYLSGLFYGVDVKLKSAKGIEPASSHIMHLIFNILPMVIIILCMYLSNKAYRIFLLVLTALFLIANGAHLIETLQENITDISQITLIGLIFVANLLLLAEGNKWRREKTVTKLDFE